MILDKEKLLIPVGIMGTILSIVIGASWWMSALYSRVVRAEEHIGEMVDYRKEFVLELRNINESLIELKAEVRRKK
jgi:ABC-type transport system involved in cytochrome c biogenesis permease subunit